MGSILCCSIPVTERDMTRTCVVAIKDKRMGFIHINWVYFVYIMSSCLRRYSISRELNTLDAEAEDEKKLRWGELFSKFLDAKS